MNYKNKYYKYKLKYLTLKKIVGGTNSQNEVQEAPQQNQEALQQNQEADLYLSDSDLGEDMNMNVDVPVNPIPHQGQDHVSETQTSETDDEQSETDDEQSEAKKMSRKTPPKKPQRYQPY